MEAAKNCANACGSLLDGNERVHLAVGVLLGNHVAGVQERELKDEREALDAGARLLHELCRGSCGATGSNEVVDDENNN